MSTVQYTDPSFTVLGAFGIPHVGIVTRTSGSDPEFIFVIPVSFFFARVFRRENAGDCLCDKY